MISSRKTIGNIVYDAISRTFHKGQLRAFRKLDIEDRNKWETIAGLPIVELMRKYRKQFIKTESAKLKVKNNVPHK